MIKYHCKRCPVNLVCTQAKKWLHRVSVICIMRKVICGMDAAEVRVRINPNPNPSVASIPHITLRILHCGIPHITNSRLHIPRHFYWIWENTTLALSALLASLG